MTPVLKVVAIASAIATVWTMAAATAAAGTKLPAELVVHGATLTQAFGCTSVALEPFDPYCASRHFHSGVDLAASEGTPVHAAATGRVRSGSDRAGCGLYVAVTVDRHVRVLYCHLSRVTASLRDVSAGDVIGAVGSTGLATGAHLHLEVDVDGRAVDPLRWLAS